MEGHRLQLAKEDACCVSFENFAYKNLGYTDERELGAGEIAVITEKGLCNAGASQCRDEDLYIFMGVLWISFKFL